MARAAAIVLDVCKALSEAHAQGVIHRDLKPGNVLVLAGDRAVVVDFGMAKIITGGGTGTTALTRHNVVFGTPEYMAPEQARGDELDARCDVYAAGILLYQLLTGAVPFSGGTPLSVLTAHLTVAPMPPRRRAPDRDISPALEAVVLHAIDKDPIGRYATAAALASAICAALQAPFEVDSVRPSPRPMFEGSAAPLELPARAVADSTDTRAIAVVRSAAPAPTRSTRSWLLFCILAALAGVVIGGWLSMQTGR
jgi:serine/threonine-protein kinase